MSRHSIHGKRKSYSVHFVSKFSFVCVCVYVFCWTFIYKYLMIDIRRLAGHTSSLACAKLSVPGSPLSGVPLMQIKVSSAQNLKLSKVLFLEPGVGDNVASNALPTVNSSDFVIHVCAFLVYSFFLSFFFNKSSSDSKWHTSIITVS